MSASLSGAPSCEPLPTEHIAAIEAAAEVPWLIDGLWPLEGVGFLGGHPKTGKSWLALDIALSVASATSSLGAFAVAAGGPVLVFAAEDAPVMVRARLEGIAAARNITLEDVPLHLVIADRLSLESPKDQERLTAALVRMRPVLLVLDPFVRMTGIDENSAQEVSRVLGFLRGLQRRLQLAILVVHHVRKSAGAGGLALRGSGDFWAWSDTNLFLARKRGSLELVMEHRSAATPEPVSLELVEGSEAGPYLRRTRTSLPDDDDDIVAPLPSRVLAVIAAASGAVCLETVREAVRARKQSVVDVLRELTAGGQVVKSDEGWKLAEP